MNMLIHTSPENLHHAYFIVGNEKSLDKLKYFLSSIKIPTVGNPDFFHWKFNTFTIEHARELALAQEKKDIGGNRKIFVVETDSITEEAQNSLLKVFEEPTYGTHFFVISPQELLLPTLKSRMIVIHDAYQDGITAPIITTSLAERILKVKEITEAISDEEATKQDAITFVHHIESELYKYGVEKYARQLKACELSRRALYDRGAPIKIILEQLVLSI